VTLYGHDQYQKDYDMELGHPWENQALWDKLSPFYRVTENHHAHPLHGWQPGLERPVIGGEQMYQAMKNLGRETELVIYPDEYHEFKTPSHIRDRLERQLAWFGHYVKGDATPATPPALGSRTGE